ncbi:MAG: TIM barrel protein [Parasporobacterium sp.]|nr:TIM barrel protein [Parasporobacterium sp.]
MKIGYMTNAFGPLVGSGGGVTSVKDIRYLTMGDDEDALRKITEVGFHSIEVLEGNLTNYADDPEVLKSMLSRYGADMMSVCVGANFIYPDALEDEMYHLEQVADMGQKIGLTYFVVCGGAIRGKGIQEGDVDLLAKGLDELQKVTRRYGLTACFHPHLGSIAEKPAQIDELFAKSDIPVCPDVAHLQAGGYDPVAFLEKYYDRIAFVHLKDWDGSSFVPMGCGQVDNDAVIRWLKAKGYDGDYLVECDGYPGDPVEACRINYEFLKGKLI